MGEVVVRRGMYMVLCGVEFRVGGSVFVARYV